MSQKISIIGGDLRNLKLIESLSEDGKIVKAYGFENVIENNNILRADSIEECIKDAKYVICGVPLSKDGKHLNAPYSNKEIDLYDVLTKISDKIFIAGVIGNETNNLLLRQNNKIIDLMKNEPITIYNAIATAEGAIAKIITSTNITLYRSNILILGYGRIGKILANRLKNFGANIYCEARKEKDIAWINADGYIPVSLENLSDFIRQNRVDIVINTIPYMILEKELLDLFSKNIYILDLASKPGGVDFEYAKELNLNVEWYLGVPGKIAPVSIAKFIKEIIS